MNELWKPVVGYKGHYEVSSLGRVRSLDRIVDSGRGKSRRHKGRVLRPAGKNTVPHVSLSVDGKIQSRSVSGMVAAAFLGPCPRNKTIIHRDGNGRNNAATNLMYGTHQLLGCVSYLCQPTRHHVPPISYEQLIRIKTHAAAGLSNTEIHRLTGVSKTTIGRIRAGKAHGYAQL